MHLLFVKTSLVWPRSSGHDVHTYEMMRALAKSGCKISLLTVAPPTEAALADLDLTWQGTFDDVAEPTQPPVQLSWLENKYCSYWGVQHVHIAKVRAQCEALGADVVVAVGLDILPYLAAVQEAQTVWYAADEWVLHHWSQIAISRPSSLAELKPGLIKGVYERAFSSRVDRVWVVSHADRRATRFFMGARNVDVIPNGVDADHYSPHHGNDEVAHSCVFWGRLDFGPNVDALRWFIGRVWPRIRSAAPSAKFSVFGFQPGPEIEQMAQAEGIELIPNLPDIRAEICRRQVVVLPFVSGAGIKNKLLEAASMARPILASRTALNGLQVEGAQPLQGAGSPADWSNQLLQLWRDESLRRELGQRARSWVCHSHSWANCADTALQGLKSC